MPDLLKILRMAPITDGRGNSILLNTSLELTAAANTHGTVFFSAPLFRPNLHYRVISKPSSAKSAVERMGMWINDNHPQVYVSYFGCDGCELNHSGKSGIVYCLSKKVSNGEHSKTDRRMPRLWLSRSENGQVARSKCVSLGERAILSPDGSLSCGGGRVS